jgi:hypothetical protein
MTSNDSTKMKRAYKKHECNYTCDKPRCIKRQRDELVKANEWLNFRLASTAKLTIALQDEIEQLETQVAKNSNTSRHWVLRKLGL